MLTALFGLLGNRAPPKPEKPLRDELLSIERLEERAKALGARFTVDPNPGRAARSVFPRLDDNARVLSEAYRTLADDVHQGTFVAPAAEWLLDNFHLVASEIRDVRQNLPRGYYRELPKLASRELAGHARVYAMAVELIRHSDSRLDRQQLLRFINSYQTVAPLTIGELWAWPSTLKLALVENLRRLAEEMLLARAARRAADAYVARIDGAGKGRPPPLPAELHTAFVVQLLQRMREYGPRLSAVRAAVAEHLSALQVTSEDAIRSEHQRQAAAQVSVANVITSLRLCSTLDWSQYFEAVSLVEQVLQRDPAGVYGSMDFPSRDRYRQAVEELAEPAGEAQVRVALRAIESARQGAEGGSTADRAAHVGYHLIGKGRRDLETDLAYRPRFGRRVRRSVFVHASAVYLGSIGLVTALLIGLGAAYVHGQGVSRWTLASVALLLLLPASEVAIAFIQRLAARLAPPRRLPRLDYQAGIPENARTMVVVPTLLTSVSGVNERLEHLEVLALGNLDPRIHFAILSDFADAPAREMPEDEAILEAARAGIEALNARFGEGHAHRFYLFHRVRQWNPGESAWMGWERKRGKIEEFNRLLRGATDTSYSLQVGDGETLPTVRYCITLDSDTRLPRDAAKKLIGIIAHPLNRPHFDPRCGRVTEGYGILQPRVSVTMASAAGSLFARLYAGHTGVDPYTTAVSDTYQDLFGEGIFTGKGLYDVDAFMAALEGRVPENALLSHDLFEGIHARTASGHRRGGGGRLSLERPRPCPPTAPLGAGRLADPVVAVPLRSHALRPGAQPPAPHLALEDPRQPAAQPAGARDDRSASSGLDVPAGKSRRLDRCRPRGARVSALSAAPGSRRWTQASTAVARVPASDGGGHRDRPRPGSAAAHIHGQPGLREGARDRADARPPHGDPAPPAGVGDGRGQRGPRSWPGEVGGARLFLVEMIASPVIALAGLVLVWSARPAALPTALPVLALWAVAPFIAYLLSRPVARATAPSSTQRTDASCCASRATPGATSRRSSVPRTTACLRTTSRRCPSPGWPTGPRPPTSAWACSRRWPPTTWASSGPMSSRFGSTPRSTTMEGLERFEGHLLNWYDTLSLAPLSPAYVSTVDSGNLAGALMTLAEGLRQLTRHPQPAAQPSTEPAVDHAGRLEGLARRAAAFADGMSFRFLYDPQRRILSIGYRLADAEGPGRLDPSYYDLLASEARLASFIAIAKGDLPETHWFHLGRLVTSVDGTPTLLSWSATLFEYLMPLLVMKSYPETLLDQTCRMAVRRQIEYATDRGVPWGISESAYNVVDRHDNYQYKAFGVPGLGLKRGLGDELVVAPYATALAAMVDPTQAARNLRRLAAEGLEGAYGYYEAIDYTHGRTDEPEAATNSATFSRGTVVRAFMAHHQGMTLVSLANALLGDPMVKRFHADPRVQATELLLQERVPRQAPITQPRPVEETRVAGPAPALAARRFRSPHTPFPHAQFLSNGNYTAVVTNAGGGASFCRGRAVTRHREDPTRDPGSQFLYLRDVRSGAVWSATYQPIAKEPEDYVVTFLAEKATFRRRDDDIATQLDIAVSTEDDVEVRRLAVTNHSDRPREIEVTSYAEIVLAPPADDLAHPAFGKLFVETEYLPESAALLCRRRPRAADEPAAWAVHVLSLEGRTQGPVEWETDRARFLGRGRGPEDPQALDGRSLSGTTGVVLDPIVSLRQRIRLAPGGFMRLSFATGMAPSRETAVALAQRYHDPSAAARTFALAFAHAQSGLRHLGISSEEALLFERLASRVLYADGSLRASPELLAAQHARPGRALAARHLGRPPHPPGARRRGERPAAGAPGPAGAGVLAAQGPERGRRDPQRAPRELPRRDARPARGAPRQRAVEDVEAPARRGVPAARRPHDRGRAHPARERGARRPERRARRAGEPARPARSRVAGAGGARALPRAELRRRVADEVVVPPLALANGTGGFADDGRDYVIVLEGGPGDAAALGQRHRQPRVRDGGHGLGLGLHLVGEQPREPPHAVRERPRDRPHVRGALRPRRRDRRDVVAHAGPDAPYACERPLRDPALRRAHPLRPRRARHPPGPRRLRGRDGPGEVLAAHAHERERVDRVA